MFNLPTLVGQGPVVWRKYTIARHQPDGGKITGAQPAIGSLRSSGTHPAIMARRPGSGPIRHGSGGHPSLGSMSVSGPVLGANDELPDLPDLANRPLAPKAPAHYDLFLETEPGDDDHKGLMAFHTLNDQPPIGDGEVLRLGAMHRRRYLHYEGPLSEDRGIVRIIDRGSFRWMPQSNPAEGQFWLFIDGGLLNGIFSIVVTPGQPVKQGADFIFQFQFSEFPS